MRKTQVFWRFLYAALVKRRSRILISLLALVVGTAVTAGLINVYYDVQAKMSKEFRTYGANLVVEPEDGVALQEPELTAVEKVVGGQDVVGSTPLLYHVVDTTGSSLVLVGIDLKEAKKVFPYWEIRGKWPETKNEALLGFEAAGKMLIKPGAQLEVLDRKTRVKTVLTIVGLVSSGDEVDNQLVVGLDLAREVSGREGEADQVYLSVIGHGEKVTQLATEISRLQGVKARPITRISTAEGRIMEKITGLVALAVAVILSLTGLCVGTTMLAAVVERRKEIGLKKALGASPGDVMKEFLSEALALGFIGGLAGWLLGFLVAQGIGYSVFQDSVALRWLTLPWTLLVSGVLTVTASWLPVQKAMSVDPAVVLRGE